MTWVQAQRRRISRDPETTAASCFLQANVVVAFTRTLGQLGQGLAKQMFAGFGIIIGLVVFGFAPAAANQFFGAPNTRAEQLLSMFKEHKPNTTISMSL